MGSDDAGLREVGGTIQFTAQCCLYMAQYPGGEVGRELRWTDLDASFFATVTGAVCQALAEAWGERPWPPQVLGAAYDEAAGLSLSILLPTEQPLSGHGAGFLSRQSDLIHLATRRGQPTLTLRLSPSKLAAALAAMQHAGCPPFAAAPWGRPGDPPPK